MENEIKNIVDEANNLYSTFQKLINENLEVLEDFCQADHETSVGQNLAMDVDELLELAGIEGHEFD